MVCHNIYMAEIFLEGGEASFWLTENYTGQVDFESHSPEWQVLSKFSRALYEV